MGKDIGLRWPFKKMKAIGSSVKQSKRARQPAIKLFWPANSVGEKQKCQYCVPKHRNIPAVTQTFSFGKNKKINPGITPIPPTPSLPCFYQTTVNLCCWFLLTGESATTAARPLKVPFCCHGKTVTQQTAVVRLSTISPYSFHILILQWQLMIIGLSERNHCVLCLWEWFHLRAEDLKAVKDSVRNGSNYGPRPAA